MHAAPALVRLASLWSLIYCLRSSTSLNDSIAPRHLGTCFHVVFDIDVKRETVLRGSRKANCVGCWTATISCPVMKSSRFFSKVKHENFIESVMFMMSVLYMFIQCIRRWSSAQRSRVTARQQDGRGPGRCPGRYHYAWSGKPGTPLLVEGGRVGSVLAASRNAGSPQRRSDQAAGPDCRLPGWSGHWQPEPGRSVTVRPEAGPLSHSTGPPAPGSRARARAGPAPRRPTRILRVGRVRRQSPARQVQAAPRPDRPPACARSMQGSRSRS